MLLETGTFSGSQKLPVSRSQTSASFSSSSRFQLIAETRSISFIFWPPRTRFTRRFFPAVLRLQTLPLGYDKAAQHKGLCLRVVDKPHLRVGRVIGPKVATHNAVEEAIGQHAGQPDEDCGVTPD